MTEDVAAPEEVGRKVRVLKAPAVRRAELLDCAQRLFLTRGYERTTVNDVIAETKLSKGAFYHHFRSKEDLLEAIAARFASESRAVIDALLADARLDALARLNLLLSLGREWKRGRIAELRAMFVTLLEPQNAPLYHRIVDAVSGVLAPALARIIADGETAEVFDAGDPELAAEVLLGLSTGRRTCVIAALETARSDVETAAGMITRRVRAEEALADRILGLRRGRVDLLGADDVLRDMLIDWTTAPAASEGAVQA
jgi:AcrR family transcriptional regulator